MRNKLDEPVPMGYCNVEVIESDCPEFRKLEIELFLMVITRGSISS